MAVITALGVISEATIRPLEDKLPDASLRTTPAVINFGILTVSVEVPKTISLEAVIFEPKPTAVELDHVFVAFKRSELAPKNVLLLFAFVLILRLFNPEL